MSIGRAGCCARVVQLCDEAEARLEREDARAAVRAVRSHLAAPLRVAVAGRVKSGKSTLVNALLRHKVAPTAYGECTRAVTWFQFGYPPQARLIFREGSTRRLPLEQGQRLPAALGADPSELERVDVELSSAALEEMTVIDTPGLESANDEYSAATRRTLALGVGLRPGSDEDAADISLRTEEAAGKADALVFVLTGAARRDEIEVLESFRSHLGGLHASAVNTLVVLNKADLVGEEDDDPLVEAGLLAAQYAERLGPLAAAVIPTVGLIAESLEAGLFNETHVSNLRALANEEPGFAFGCSTTPTGSSSSPRASRGRSGRSCSTCWASTAFGCASSSSTPGGPPGRAAHRALAAHRHRSAARLPRRHLHPAGRRAEGRDGPCRSRACGRHGRRPDTDG